MHEENSSSKIDLRQTPGFIDGMKMLHEIQKQLTVLSTGSIVILTSFGGQTSETKMTALLGLALGLLMVTAGGSTILMALIGSRVRGKEYYEMMGDSWY